MRKLSLSTPTSELFMIGSAYAQRLAKLNIFTAEDLIHHYPFRYNDFRLKSNIAKAQAGETTTIVGQIVSFQNIFTKGGKRVQKMLVTDSTGQIQVIFFNQPFLNKILKPGLKISLSGKAAFFDRKISLITPEYEILKSQGYYNTIHTGRLAPVYPETYKLSSKWLRSRIAPILTKLLLEMKDWEPSEIKKFNNLIDIDTAIKQIHFPQNPTQINSAIKRLAFDELFMAQLQTLAKAHDWKKNKTSVPFKLDKTKISFFVKKLPFRLTDDQKKAAKQILNDLRGKTPMNRLLQGDVGCGKTVIAAIASYSAYLNGCQTAVMAPTEILACQHYETFKQLLSPYGLKIGLVTGSRSDVTMKQSNNETIDILIGTHALLFKKGKFENLGLAIIDEQHRFGVQQRASLIQKGKGPHTLIMTATPIPRTIALALYGDLDLSIISQMPAGRLPAKTWVVPPEKRLPGYQWIAKQVVQNKQQAFIVCPFIDESNKESMKNIKAVKKEFSQLSSGVFSNLKLDLLHGKLKSGQKEKVISDFRNKKTDILVSTPVVEVGIDIPEATIILIEAADRFGLATLHQLRGRVGRRDKQAYCLLFSSEAGKSYRRLKLMEKYTNGLKLAEMDLKLRGQGDIYGTAQHGFSRFKLAKLDDLKMVKDTKSAAQWAFKEMQIKPNSFSLLKEKLKNYTIKQIEPN